MVRLKGGGNLPSQSSGEPTPVEIDLQTHREETTAKFSELQESLEAFRTQQTLLCSEIMEELKQLRLGRLTLGEQDDPPVLKFGSLPTASSPVKTPVASETSSMTVTTAEGNLNLSTTRSTRDLTHTEVILGLNSAMPTELITISGAQSQANTVVDNNRKGKEVYSVSASGVVVDGNKEVLYGNGGVNTSGLHSHRVSPNHYFQHTNFGSQPFNSCGQIHTYNSQAQPQGYHSQMDHFPGYDPFMMTYSGPYSVTAANAPSHVVPTLPFAVPTFLQAQGLHPFGSAAPTMATVTTHAPYSPHYHHQTVGTSQFPNF